MTEELVRELVDRIRQGREIGLGWDAIADLIAEGMAIGKRAIAEGRDQ